MAAVKLLTSSPWPSERHVREREGNKIVQNKRSDGTTCFIKKRTLNNRVVGRRAVSHSGDPLASPAAFGVRDPLTDSRPSTVLRAGDGRGRVS